MGTCVRARVMRLLEKRLAILEAAATPVKTALVVVGMPFLPSD